MKIPNFRRIFRQDFEEQFHGLIDTLSSTVNINFEFLYSALQRRVSLSDNIFCTIRDIQVIVNNDGIPTSSTAFALDSFLTSVQGLMVLNVTNITNPSGYPTSGVTISFSQTQTGIIINHITGLIPTNNYLIRVVVFG